MPELLEDSAAMAAMPPRQRGATALRELLLLTGRYPHLDEHDLWQSCLSFAETVIEAAAPYGPLEVLNEIGRLALLVNKAEVEAYADADGMKPRHRRFTCKCGADWMTLLPDVETCQRCYHMGQPDIEDWIKCEALPEPLPSDSFICTGGKHVYVGKPCPHCGAKERGSVCKLG